MTDPQDLRCPDIDETPLSTEEVRHGVVRGFIPPGPRAHAHAFVDVYVGDGWATPGRLIERRRVEVWQIGEVAA